MQYIQSGTLEGRKKVRYRVELKIAESENLDELKKIKVTGITYEGVPNWFVIEWKDNEGEGTFIVKEEHPGWTIKKEKGKIPITEPWRSLFLKKRIKVKLTKGIRE